MKNVRVQNPMFRFALTLNPNLHWGLCSIVSLNPNPEHCVRFGFEHCSQCSEPDRGQSRCHGHSVCFTSLTNPIFQNYVIHNAFLTTDHDSKKKNTVPFQIVRHVTGHRPPWRRWNWCVVMGHIVLGRLWQSIRWELKLEVCPAEI